jgi:putative hydrolase of the HAD superfamily
MLHRIGSPAWSGPFDEGSDRVWAEFQAGVISEYEHWLIRAREVFPSSNDPVRDLMATVFAPPPEEFVRREVMQLIASAQRPALLTNDLSRFHGDDWLAEIGMARTFDPLIDLSRTGFLKPETRAFEHALSLLGDEPGDVVFVDDQPRNVEAAAALGIAGIWFDVTAPSRSVRTIRDAL